MSSSATWPSWSFLPRVYRFQLAAKDKEKVARIVREVESVEPFQLSRGDRARDGRRLRGLCQLWGARQRAARSWAPTRFGRSS
jgi:hypothetical protein